MHFSLLFPITSLLCALGSVAIPTTENPLSATPLTAHELSIRPASVIPAPGTSAPSLSKRATGQLVVCTAAQCQGVCTGYPLGSSTLNTCYNTVPFTSAYVEVLGTGGVPYFVYVGPNCQVVKLPTYNQCYTINSSVNSTTYLLRTT